MKKVSLLLSVLLFCSFGSTAIAESYVPSRTINLVYDDSGSMIRMGADYVDTWCQAKYAMEVVAAMLGERDTLNIYYMSDYDNGTDAPPRLRLHGSRYAAAVKSNVDKIHETVTAFGNTPFNAVRKASEDIKTAGTDERWLVVLTDGEFEDGRMSGKEVENYYAQVVDDKKTKVIMLAMGPQAATIKSDEANGIYFEHAVSTADILPQLTSICNRIFQRNALEVIQQNRDYRINFGVPMKQLIVFAQGKNAKIGDTIKSGDQVFEQSSNVHAAYSTKSSLQNPAGTVVADNLNGYVATYNAEFEPGIYNLSVTGAESLEVYYKPNVAINAYLFDADGKEVTDSADIVNGRYRLEFGFVNASTNAKVTDTSLLGEIKYSSTITNTAEDGTVISRFSASSGDMITIKEGKIDIDVTAAYLKYNTVNTKLHYQVFFRNELVFELGEMHGCRLTADGLENTPITVSVRMKDGDKLIPLTPKQWAGMETPQVSTASDAVSFDVRKGEPGIFIITPSVPDPFAIRTTSIPFTVRGGFSRGKSSASGQTDGSLLLVNAISPVDIIKKRNISIQANLFDDNGNRVTNLSDIVNGRYKIEFGLYDAATHEEVTDKVLTEGIRYNSKITNTAPDGTVTGRFNAASGDTIAIREGSINIDVTATDNENKSVSTKLLYQVFFRNELVFETNDDLSYELTSVGLENRSVSISVRMKDGDHLVPLTQEQWDALTPPKLTAESDICTLNAKKGEPGQLIITPSIGDTDPMTAMTGTTKFNISTGFTIGKSSASGHTDASLTIEDKITFMERLQYWIVRHLVQIILGIIAFIIILGYIVKKRFPKSIVRYPVVNCQTVRNGREMDPSSAEFRKNKLSSYLPYVPEKAIVQFDVDGIIYPTLQAHSNRGILLTNAEIFAENECYDFGKEIQKDKPFTFSPSTEISITLGKYIYTYTLTQGEKK